MTVQNFVHKSLSSATGVPPILVTPSTTAEEGAISLSKLEAGMAIESPTSKSSVWSGGQQRER